LADCLWVFIRAGLLPVVCATLLANVSSAEVLRTLAPPGFEDLDQPQRTLIDVVFLGRVIGGVAVEVQGALLQFEQPLRLLAQLDELADSKSVLGVLSGPLPANAELLCRSNTAHQEGCGRLQPEIAGVIYDRARFTAELFVNPAFISSNTAQDLFLPPPEPGVFAFSRFFGSLSGSTDGDTRLGLQQDMRLGAGATRLVANTYLSNQDAAKLDALRLESDQKLWRYTAGRFYAASLFSISDLNMLGVSVRTHTDGLVNKRLTDLNQLAVFLNRRGQVRVLREGRVLFSQTFAAGRHIIAPGLMPDGAYEVTLQISEDGAPPREETRFFVSRHDIPGPQIPFYFFDAGRLLDASDVAVGSGSDYVLRAGGQWRLAPSLALGGHFLGARDNQIVELDTTWLREGWSARSAWFASSVGDLGVDSTLSVSAPRWHYSFSLRRILAGRSKTARGFLHEIARSRTRATLAMGGVLGRWIVSSNVSFSQTGDAGTRSANLQVRYTLPQRSFLRSNVLFDLGYMDERLSASLALNMRFGAPTRPVSVEAGYRAINLRSDRRSAQRAGAFQRVSASGNFVNVPGAQLAQASISIDRTPDHSNLRLWSDYQSRIGRLFASGNLGRAGGSTTGTYDVHLHSGLYASNLFDAGRVLGAGGGAGGAAGDAALLIALNGEAPNTEFTINVDSATRGRLRAGEQLAITLPAYRTYDVRIAEHSRKTLHYDRSTRRITLFPGNVAYAAWQASVVVPAFGRVVDMDGAPLRNVQVLGASAPTFTDDRGYFTVEIPASTVLRFMRPHNACEVFVVIDDPDTLFARLGTLRCST
jgi:hypothetical protein